MDDWGVAPALCLFSAVLRLSLLSPFGREGRASASEGKGVGLGEGRVEGFSSFGCRPCELLTSILSPLRKERGESTCAKRVPAPLSGTVNST